MRIRTAMAATAMAASAVLAGAGAAAADAGAGGAAIGSPGVLSGNVIQLPLHVPVNACGNSVNVIGVLNPTFGNTCANF
ncbi:chaplin [Streptomyces sp. NPDC006971]|uniref:chaplin n=1 Tax=Streptomyces sp. NPDC006971 TaxID=3154784 RepID=UPI003401357D